MKVKRKRRWKQRTPMQRRRTANRLCGILLCAALPVCGVATLCAYGMTESGERLSLLPSRFSAAVQTSADAALSEQAIARDALVRQVTKVVAATGGFRVGDVYFTEDRLLECPAPLDLENLSETAQHLNALYQTYQVPMCLIAVPAAGEFYAAEELGGLSIPSQLEEIDAFYQEVDSAIRKIDVYHVLYTMTDNYIYNRTDPRWTCYGAYCVYRSAIQKMGFAPISFDQYTVNHVTTYRGELYDACLYAEVTPDILDVYTCSFAVEVTDMTAFLADGTEEEREMYQEADAEDPYAYYLGEDCEKLVIKTDLENQKKLLILKDSYANCMIPFLLQHYSEVCVIDVHAMTHELSDLVDVTSYSQVLVLCDADTFAEEQAFSKLGV